MSKNNQRGFTLLTVALAVAVVAVLAAIVLFGDNPDKRVGDARDAKRSSDVMAISKALGLYVLDNDKLPSDIEDVIIDYDEKTVLCSSAGSLICDGQTRDCLVIDDVDFLDKYLVDLPVDPKKADTSDTGYYITRNSNNDAIVIGACDTYDVSVDIEILAQTTLPDLPVCGNGVIETGETCDDGDTTTEACGNNIVENGTYCRADCGAVIVLNEICDDDNTFTEGCGNGVIELAGTYCNHICTIETTIGDEWCDSNLANGCYHTIPGEEDWYYSAGHVYNVTYCSKFTVGCNDSCDFCISMCSA